MRSRTLLLAATLLPFLVGTAIAQSDAHHPSGAATSSPAPVATDPPVPMPSPAAQSDSGTTNCPTTMTMADMMNMMQDGTAAGTPQMQVMKMMKMMAAMQMMQMNMMQQMLDEMTKTEPAPAPTDKQP